MGGYPGAVVGQRGDRPRRHALGPLLSVCVAMGLSFMAYAMFAPLVPLLALSLGASPAHVGIIVGLAFIPALFMAIPMGGAVDRWGAMRLLRLGGACLVLAPLAMTLHRSLWTLVAFQVGVGLAQLAIIVAAQTVVAALNTGRRRERDYGWYTTALSLAHAIGPLVGGALVDAVGFGATFLGSAIVASVAFASFSLLRTVAPIPAASPVTIPTMLRQLPSLAADPGLRVAIGTSMAVQFGILGVHAFLPVRLDALGYSATTIGTLFGVMALAAVVVRPFVSSLSGMLGVRWRTLVAVVFFVAVGLLAPTTGHSLASYVVMVVCAGLGSGVSQPLSMAMTIDHAVGHDRGLALGLRLTGNRVVQAGAPIVLGVIATFWGVAAVFPVAAVVIGFMNVTVIRSASSIDLSREHGAV